MTATLVDSPPQQRVAVRWTLREGATATPGPDGVLLRCSRHEVPLGLGAAGRAVLQALAAGPVGDAEIVQVAERADPAAGMTGLLKTTMLVQRLAGSGWLAELLYDGDELVAGLHHDLIGPVAAPAAGPLRPALSRFAMLTHAGGALRASSPLATASVSLHADAGVLAAVALCRGQTADGPAGEAVTRLLARAGLLTAVDEDPETLDPRLAQWSLPDLLFHTTSRAGRSLAGYGGTYAKRDSVPELPATVPASGPVLALPRPDLLAGRAATAPFGEVLEARHSTRAHDDAAPIELAQLSELLFRTARERRRLTDEDGTELSDRPYPCGGARYELELYPVITRCAGLAPGIYRYLADSHGLELVSEDSPAVRQFVALAGATGLFTSPPQVALVVTARFGRVMTKYESMAYALVLKHVGVLYQSLYLTCTAMGLAACGIGGGSADAFAALSGRDYYAESSVGEFLLGSRPAAPAAERGGD